MGEYLADRGISVRRFEMACGMSCGSWKSSANPTARFILNTLYNYPDLSAEWLLRGEGEMLRRPAEEQSMEACREREAQMAIRLSEKDRLISWLMKRIEGGNNKTEKQ